jgi:protein-S-isoprenylcysteine O-methyltransferase Ste14
MHKKCAVLSAPCILFLIILMFFGMLLRHLISITSLPVTVTIIIPAVIASLFLRENFWGLNSLALLLLLIVGLLLIGAGLILFYLTISLFITMGNGTIAPWSPTSKLIVGGVYGNVRNPMITCVFLVLTGESIILGSIPVAIWTILFILANLIFIPLIEEPELAERFGDEYLIYKENVPRWIPRLSRWKKD